MAENINRNIGRGSGYQLNKGGVPTESGPFVGVVKNNNDPTRSGRIQVYIETFSGIKANENNPDNWRTLNYLSPFMGVTKNPFSEASQGTAGTTINNKQSYGMWFSAPDVGTKVLCFFANGDPNQGYYLGSVMEPGIGHMIPAIGSSARFAPSGKYDLSYQKLPVGELAETKNEVGDFYREEKPIHKNLTSQFTLQGLVRDNLRGTIGSNSQRESPSRVFGVSTPGAPLPSLAEQGIDLSVGLGHSFVMDDGDSEQNDRLIRLRTSKGHQISLIDGPTVIDSDGNESHPDACIYITHSNGCSWIELGKEGTLDVFSTNSINLRTNGTINLHADEDINMYAGRNFNAFSKNTMKLESTFTSIRSEAELKLYSKLKLVARSDNILALDAEELGSFDGGDSLVFSADCISLNSGAGVPVSAATSIRKNKVADVKIENNEFTPEQGKLETIATRVPTHEPWPYHNRGTSDSVDYSPTTTTAFPEFTTEALQTAAQFSPNGIGIDDYTSVTRATTEIGTLGSEQLTGLKAQIAKTTGLDYADFNVDIGVGKFGLSPEQLERAGYLTPGTVANYLRDPADTESLLNNTNFWTEKDGISDLPAFLNSVAAQDSAVQLTMQDSFSKLRSNGVVKGTESAGDLGGILTGAVRYGVDNTVKWAKGQDLNSTVKNGISQSVRDGQFAVAYTDEKITPTMTSFSSPGGYQNTVQLDNLNKAVTNDLGGGVNLPYNNS